MAHTSQPVVLLVEDEPVQREVLAYNLGNANFWPIIWSRKAFVWFRPPMAKTR